MLRTLTIRHNKAFEHIAYMLGELPMKVPESIQMRSRPTGDLI